MPLSRTRSLLANINGVANGANGSTNGQGSTANTPGSEANGYALPSINGSSDHLPPLKSQDSGRVPNGTVASNNNKFFNTSNGGSLTNGYLHNDMDVISTSSSLQSTNTSLTTNGDRHFNGMQTLPHVRSEARSQIISGLDHATVDVVDIDNDKSQSVSQPNQSSSVRQSQQDSNQQNSVVQQSPTNSSALSNNAVNAANNSGSLKPKTMVATPEQVCFNDI